MKNQLRVVLSAIVVLVSLNAVYAQRFKIEQLQYRVIEGKSNLFRVTVADKSCNEIVATTDNGTIQQDNCVLLYTPAKPGKARLSVAIKSGKELEKIGDTILSVEPNRCSPVITLLGRTGSGISAEELSRAVRLEFIYPGCSDRAHSEFSVNQYWLFIRRGKELIYSKLNVPGHTDFDVKTLALFRNLEVGDTVMFASIIVMGPDKKHRNMGQIKFDIADYSTHRNDTNNSPNVGALSSRIISLSDTAKSHALAMTLINKIKAGKIKAYPYLDRNSSPLSLEEANNIFAPTLDTIEVEEIDGGFTHKVIKTDFSFSALNGFKVLECTTFNSQTNATTVKIVSVALLTDGILADDSYGYQPLCWLIYDDIQEDINTFDHKHPAGGFGDAIWKGRNKR